MTIKVTMDEFNNQFQEADEVQLQWDATDELDRIYKFDARFSQGWRREIQLR
ncbi:MAG: AraC family transcriptional regulator, partial [Leptolyngbya sp. SIO4C1]|nr:AraC family transcriptional regulator [Leptolyngbya sp. SIO4C1]